MTQEEAANWIEHYCYGNTNILRDCDDDITEKIQTAMDEAIAALRGPQPDPDTGLVPCGCGGVPYPHFQLGWYREDTGKQRFEVCTGCDKCGMSTKPRHGYYIDGKDVDETELASIRDWNVSRGCSD